MNPDDLPHLVIGACMQVHNALGPGLTKDAYSQCLALELRQLDIPFEQNKPLTFEYRGHCITSAMLLDFVIDDCLMLKVAASEADSVADKHQMETCLKLSGARTGLIVNFDVTVLRKGLQRITVKRLDEEIGPP